MMNTTQIQNHRKPWNKGKLVEQKAPLKLREIWAIRIRLQLSRKVRDLALFNLAIDSKLAWQYPLSISQESTDSARVVHSLDSPATLPVKSDLPARF